MIKKIFLLLLFPFLGASLLTFAENRIPQNGWTKDAYHFKLDRPNTKIAHKANVIVYFDGGIIKPLDLELMRAHPEDRYRSCILEAEDPYRNVANGCKFTKLIVQLNISVDSISELNSLIGKTNIDSLLLQFSKSQRGETLIGDRFKYDDSLKVEFLKRVFFYCGANGKPLSLKPQELRAEITKSCTVPVNDTIIIGYKLKVPSTLEEWFDKKFDENMIELSIQNENPTLSYMNNLWETYKHALDGFQQSEAPYTGRRAYIDFINKIRKETVPALIEKANKTLPADCDPQIRNILENRLKMEFYSNNPMALYAAESQQFLPDAFTVLQDIEFNEDMLYDLPTACRIVSLIGKYTGVLRAERHTLPQFVIQMLQAKGYTYNPERADLGYQIEDIPVQEWCDNVKELLRNYSINANDFLVYFMTIIAYDNVAGGLNKKQVDNIKHGYKSGDWQVPLKAIQLHKVYYQNQLDLRIEE